MKELISIITPTYNRAYILVTAIKSVFAQTYANWELIIVDDGSSDNTHQLVEQFKDGRIHYLAQQNKGASAARNNGLSRAQGKWIVYLDSDNEFLPNCLEVLLESVTNGKNILYAVPKGIKTLELYENDKQVQVKDVSAEEYPEEMTLSDIFMRTVHFDLNAFVHARRITDEGIRFDEQLRHFDDWDFFMQIAEKYPASFLYIQLVLYRYHQRYGGDGVVSNTTYKEWAEGFEYIYQKHKHDKLLQGQQWYPDRVKKYKKLEADYHQGKAVAPYLKYFF